ncbi:hypothetical protein RRG08_040435 [Elysia crispata]|uniref:Uncharacterized protein n=1 Tax=Elysia crispata TaxID=231223 RepID=A0AAE0ZCH3_9GAST|nr:hypothetical protein RRG08_040435 [Elysia crispata]
MYEGSKQVKSSSPRKTLSGKAIQNTTPLPTMEELEAPPTIDELRKTIDALSCGMNKFVGAKDLQDF